MAMEELYESDVLWPDARDLPVNAPGSSVSPATLRVSERRGLASSRPVDIPTSTRSRRRDGDEEEGDDDGDAMVPPHVLASRRRPEGRMAFSLRSGPGRARDLNHLRNSVLRMTGFLEG